MHIFPLSPGFLVNNDVPMYIGFDCDGFYFDGGKMDEVRIALFKYFACTMFYTLFH